MIICRNVSKRPYTLTKTIHSSEMFSECPYALN